MNTFLDFFLSWLLKLASSFFFSSGDASHPKRSNQGAEDEFAGDDATVKDSVPSVVVEPSLKVTMTSALASKPATPSTSGTVPALKVLKVKKLNVKKSSL
jgi:hypothetical protein